MKRHQTLVNYFHDTAGYVASYILYIELYLLSYLEVEWPWTRHPRSQNIILHLQYTNV